VQNSRLVTGLLPAFLVIAASALAFYKVSFLGYNLEDVSQSESYYLETVMEFDGHGGPVEITMALPQNLPNQSVSDEAFTSDDLKFSVTNADGNRRGVWQSTSVRGKEHIGYTASVITRDEQYVIDSTLPTEQQIPAAVARYLLPDSSIQSDSPEIAELTDSLGLSSDSSFLFNATSIYSYATYGLKYVKYSGTTDALTAFHLGEASCGGKSRLMAALARHIGIPARLVGGKILSSGQSKATHIWVELYLDGYWVPFCPTNKYFAEMPSNYLILYYGEHPVITHTRDINFKYYFNLKKRLVSTAAGLAQLKNSPLDILNVWSTFKRVAISLELLKIIIMLPIGVLAVVLFRNIVGIETFGTFMPALIAIGFRDTGLWAGMLLFGLIIMFGALIRSLLNRMQLLHTPRLAIILSSVVLFMLFITGLGVSLGFLNLARVALFPMVILTLTVERFSIISEQFGWREAVRISALTLLVAGCAYTLMSWRQLQSVVIAFPETILVVIAIYIYIGRYSGFRLMEFSRFKHLLVRS
jgi:transglutaminase-like putative cysteine protease